MQCFIDSIILTISLVLKLLSFCGFRALFLLLLQIKFPQWFVSFERQKMCVGYKICARACLLICVSEQTYFCVSPCMHALWMFAHLLIVIPVHMCILCSFMSRSLIFVHVCLHTFEDRYMFAGLVIFMLVCVCGPEVISTFISPVSYQVFSNTVSFVCLEIKYSFVFVR